MNKQIKHTYGGMTKDISKSRFPNTSYYDASAFRVTASEGQSTYSLANEKGTKVQITFPNYTVSPTQIHIIEGTHINISPHNAPDIPIGVHTDHKLVGSITVKDGIVFFTTGTIDTIWKYSFDNENYIKLLYARDLGFTQDNQITGISNYENEKIEKIYWVDGLHQLRHLNIRHSKDNGDYENIIDIPTSTIEMISNVAFNQPIIKDISTGGNHTAGVIQYAYSLYKINGNSSNISPLSKQVPLTNGSNGGGDINEKVNTVPIVRIEDIDNNYTNIIVYSIKYTSFGVLPDISIIYDQVIPESRNVEIFDSGSIISSITIEEFILKLQDVKIPNHIASKDNRLFISNYIENNFKVNLDVRAYSFNSPIESPVSRVYSDVESLNNLSNTPVRLITPVNFPDDPNDTFDNINLDYDTYKYSLSFHNTGLQMEPTIGGTNKYLTYEIIQTPVYNSRNKYFKDDEIYRLGIEFYNEYGVNTKPMWIADFKAPSGNTTGLYNMLKFTWKQSFYDWFNSQTFNNFSKPVGYKILIAERNADDKTIITSGVASTMMFNFGNTINTTGENAEAGNNAAIIERGKIAAKMPSFLIRNLSQSDESSLFNTMYKPLRRVKNNLPLELSWMGGPLNESTGGTMYLGTDVTEFLNAQYTKMIQLYSPDTVFNQNLNITKGLKLKIKSLLKNTENKVWAQELYVSDQRIDVDGKGDGISMFFAQNKHMTAGAGNHLHDRGLIGHPGGSDANMFMKNLWYRRYGATNSMMNNINSHQSVFNNNVNFIVNKVNDISKGDVSLYNTTGGLLFRVATNNINTTKYYRIGFSVNIQTDTPIPYDYMIKVGNIKVVEGSSNNTNTTIDVSETVLEFPTAIDLLTLEVFLQSSTGIPITGNFNITGNLDGDNIIQLSDNDTFDVTENYNLSGGPFNYSINTNVNNDNDNHQKVTGNNIFEIYGSAEYALRGQSFTSYNKDAEFRYVNTLNSFRGLKDRTPRQDQGVFNRTIVSIGSDAVGNITIVPLDANNEYINLEDIYSNLITEDTKMNDCIPYIELVKSKEDIYLGGIYGGNSYEDKLRTKYISIGEYSNIDVNSVYIESPGDTFVHIFKFLRISRSDELAINQGVYHMEEIVEFPVETTIDLENRNDLSTSDWDSKISYSFDEYHKYNRVYSQPDNLRVNVNNEYNVKDFDQYETNIISSKLKTSGEIIDNWLTLLPNESIDLDGKFGPITNLLFLNNEIYTLQDRAFSKLSINPRVQVQGDDGISIELGSGQVLQDYHYITTDIGCKNKHGSIVTPYGIYFYDSNNKRLNLFNGQITPLSETAGLHSYLYNKNLNNIDLDKPLKGTGLSLGYDYINNDVYFSFLTNNEDAFTLRYTEKGNLFMDDNKYLVNHYAGFGDKFYGNLSDNKIHQFGKGDYNNYFGTITPSKVTLIVNPEADLSVVVNNIMFKSEAYLDGVDQPNITLSHIRAYNEYQDSGQVPLLNNRRGNIQRLFREWNAQVPRVAGTRERIRNPWTYLELTFNNPNNYKFILHDMNISYSV